jgi:hypothetical protein
MKITTQASWRGPAFSFVYLEVNGKKLSFEGTPTECEQIAKDLRSRINRSGRKKNLTSSAPVATL